MTKTVIAEGWGRNIGLHHPFDDPCLQVFMVAITCVNQITRNIKDLALAVDIAIGIPLEFPSTRSRVLSISASQPVKI